MAGYLTRLSTTGLANVTSGGGQVRLSWSANRFPARQAGSRIETELDTIDADAVWPRPIRSACPAPAMRSVPVSSIQPGERVALDRGPGERAGGGEPRAGAGGRRRGPTLVLIEAVPRRPMTSRPPEILDALEQCRRGHPVRAAAGRRTAGAHGHRRTGRAAPDPLRAHGRRDAADHARGHAGGLPAGRSPQPAAVRAHGHGVAALRCGRRRAPTSPPPSIRRSRG